MAASKPTMSFHMFGDVYQLKFWRLRECESGAARAQECQNKSHSVNDFCITFS
jgi:hypothetical protein